MCIFEPGEPQTGSPPPVVAPGKRVAICALADLGKIIAGEAGTTVFAK